MTARVLDAADAAVALVLAGWSDKGEADGVTRVYAPPVNLTEDSDSPIAGRQVFVFPGPYDAAQLDRADQWRRYTLRVLVVERYTAGAGGPPTAWVDERVGFVQTVVFDPLADQSLVLVGEMTPDPEADDAHAAVDTLYDVDVLLNHKTFWSVMTFVFREPTSLAGATT